MIVLRGNEISYMITRAKKKRGDKLRKLTVDEILKDFLDPSPGSEKEDSEPISDEEYLNEFFKKSAKKKIERYRKDLPLQLTEIKKPPEPPVASQKLTPVRKCQSCYYCSSVKKIGSSWWVACTNSGRTTEAPPERLWIKSELNRSCWKPLD